ncbi:MAG TPA: hypothetical protein VKR41_04700 [Puia sp.]|nr:hypothetical protein [Puia sp.]
MKQTIVSLTILLLICAGVQRSIAQQDTTHLDAGYLTLNKEFTQQISIKGADLQKMPFINLSDAISAWLYGAYTTPASVQYVVDGNPVADVNAYSIYDVEEVVLVQHAAALIGTAPGQAETILIRTRRGVGPNGITVAAQTGLIAEASPSHARLFHNYYAGAYRNAATISYGLSANYIRDAIPYEDGGGSVVTPPNWQRWRLNGYFEWRPDAHNQIEITMNYTPQKLNGLENPNSGQGVIYGYKESGYQHYLTPHLDWRGEWAKGFTNDLQATYLHSRLSTDQTQLLGEPATDSIVIQENLNLSTSYHLWIRDHLAFAFKTGGWTIEPAINFSYDHINDQYMERNIDGMSIFPLFNLSASYYLLEGEEAIGEKTNFFLVTPGVDVTYKRGIEIMGGAMINTGTQSLTGNGKKVYPYAGATVDLLRLGDPEKEESLKLFGSVASRTITSSQAYTLQDFSQGNFPLISIGTFTAAGGSPPQPPPNYVPPVLPVFWTWEAGARYSGLKGRLEVSYQFEHRISAGLGTETYSTGWEGPAYPAWYSALHHLDVRVEVVEAPGASWRTGLNVTGLRTTMKTGDSTTLDNAPMGDLAPGPWSWTGGWVNRIRVKDFTAGLDLLYHFNEPAGYVGKLNSVAIPNIFLGYELHMIRTKALEVYVESRGLITSQNSDVTDPRAYFTIGGKLTM